ncbi:hypothetical protein Zmor_022164 [Zophobas morio]|uniref:C2H2-type domain-containing protein n=1 Tax=Zophobas morio TaxID=2755281 RepID=A0AA38HVX3_9CUCU|nr:hypothetical protein Zmor_022164 [Zophobas morio]
MAHLEYHGTNTAPSKFYKSVHRCKKCPYYTKSIFFMKNHVRRHKVHHKFNCGEILETFSCYECRFTTHLITCFNQHIQHYHHHINQKETKFLLTRYTCTNCVFQTHFALSWLKHQITCTKTATKPHCISTINTQLKIQSYQHIKPETNYSCDKCNYKVSRFKCLQNHIRRQHPAWDSKKWLECDHCPYRSTKAHVLQKHINMKHTSPEDAEWFECNHCHWKTRLKVVLRRHIRYNHLEVKWFQCNHCDYKSKFVANLRKHLVTKHTTKENIQWFQCDKCDYRAKLKQTLKYHVETKHTPEIMKCPKCTFRTAVESILTKHRREKHGSGGGAKEVRRSMWRKCEECGAEIEKNHWSRHQKEVHGDVNEIQWFECQKCTFKSKRKHSLKRHQENRH